MQMVEIGLADGDENPVLLEVKRAKVPLRANSKPAKCTAEAAAMNKMAWTRAKLSLLLLSSL